MNGHGETMTQRVCPPRRLRPARRNSLIAVLAGLLLPVGVGRLTRAADDAATDQAIGVIGAPDEFRVSSGDYSFTVQKFPAWTFRSVSYRGRQVLIPNGWMQPVLNVQSNGKSEFVGTGHGGEVVLSLTLSTGEGADLLRPHRKDYHAADGATMRLTKRSMLGPLLHESVLEVSAEGFAQRYGFEVRADTAQVNWLYAFMLIFPNEADRYQVILADGTTVAGCLPGAAKIEYSLHRDRISQLSVFNAAMGLVTTFVTASPYPTRDQRGGFFADRPRDNKFYLQVIPPRRLGEKVEYRMKMRCAESTIGDFPATADALAKMITN